MKPIKFIFVSNLYNYGESFLKMELSNPALSLASPITGIQIYYLRDPHSKVIV